LEKFRRSIDPPHHHGYSQYVEKLLTIDDSHADDPRQYFHISQSSPHDIRAFAVKKRLQSSATFNDETLFRVFSLRAMLALACSYLDPSATRELHRLLNQPLSLFSFVYPDTAVCSATWEGKILLAVGFVAEASRSRSKDKSFQSLANARAVLPCVSNAREEALINQINSNRNTDSASNQAQLSVKAQESCAKPLKRSPSLNCQSMLHRSGGRGR
jgi:hypothetical protein